MIEDIGLKIKEKNNFSTRSYFLYLIPQIILTFVVTISLFNTFVFVGPTVSAAGGSTFCDFFPCPKYAAPGQNLEDNVITSTERFIQTGLNLVFIGIIALGIFLMIKAALTIIRSEGDSGKIQKGAQIMKSVFIGIGMIFFGLIGIILIAAFFNASEIFNQDFNEPDGVNIPFLD